MFIFVFDVYTTKIKLMTNNLNSGALFTNDNPTSDKAPDYTGGVNVGGKEYKVAGWVNESKTEAGKTYLSLKLTDFEQNNQQGRQQYPSSATDATATRTGYTGTAKEPATKSAARPKMF